MGVRSVCGAGRPPRRFARSKRGVSTRLASTRPRSTRSTSVALAFVVGVAASCATPAARFWQRWGPELSRNVEAIVAPLIASIPLATPPTPAEVRALVQLAVDPRDSALERFRRTVAGTKFARTAVYVAGTAILQLTAAGFPAEAERLAQRALALVDPNEITARVEARLNAAITQLFGGRRRDAAREVLLACAQVRRARSLPHLLRCGNQLTMMELRHGRPKSAARRVFAMCRLCRGVPGELGAMCQLRCFQSRLQVLHAAEPEGVPRLARNLEPLMARVGSGLGALFADNLPRACRRLAFLGKPDEALACLENLRRSLAPQPGSATDVSLRMALATLYVDEGQYTNAVWPLRGIEGAGVDLLHARMRIAEKRWAEALGLLRRVERASTKEVGASAHVLGVVRITKGIREIALRASLRSHVEALRGRIAEERGAQDDARAHYKAALAHIDKARMFFIDPLDPGRVAESDSPVLRGAWTGLVRMAASRYAASPSAKAAHEVWRMAERRRGQQLRARWQQHPSLDATRFLSAEDVAATLERERSVRSLRSLWAHAEVRGDAATIARAETDLAEAAREEAWFLRRLRASPRARERLYAELRAPDPRAPELGLLPGEALVQFHVGADAAYRFVLRGKEVVRVDRIAIERRALATRIERLLRPLRQGDVTRFDVRAAKALHDLLLGGAAETLAGTERLLVVPDGPLWGLPFELLVVQPATGEDLSKTRFLGLERPLLYLPTASTIRALRAPREGEGEGALLAVGDPVYGPEDERCRGALAGLCRRRFGRVGRRVANAASAYRGIRIRRTEDPPAPGPVAAAPAPATYPAPSFERLPATGAEVAAVSSLPWAQSRSLVALDATETTVVRAMLDPKVRVVHFATHAILGTEVPGVREPALVFVGEPARSSEDGYLTAREIAGLDLRAETVVLSACHTGAGGTLRGEGAQSLGYSFLLAGAREVVASLWPVDDRATAELMKVFHRERAHGAGEALRRARNALASSGRAHPFYWAAFVVLGGR